MLENIVRLQTFDAAPDEVVQIQVSQNVLLMPIFRWNGTHWTDAIGQYDFCMLENQITYEFISRIATTEKFAYRYIPAFYLAQRLAVSKG